MKNVMEVHDGGLGPVEEAVDRAEHTRNLSFRPGIKKKMRGKNLEKIYFEKNSNSEEPSFRLPAFIDCSKGSPPVSTNTRPSAQFTCPVALCEFLRSRNSSHIVPPNHEMNIPDNGVGTKCRGRGLLFRKTGIVIGVSAIPDRTCRVGEPCSLRAYDCMRWLRVANSSASRSEETYSHYYPIRKATPGLAKVELLTRVVGSSVASATTKFFGNSADAFLQISFIPRAAGLYNFEPRLHFLSDNCEAVRVDDASKGKGPAAAVKEFVFLGGLERRCGNSNACRQKIAAKSKNSRFFEPCDNEARLTLHPLRVHVLPSPPLAKKKKAWDRCTDGYGQDGQWFRFGGCGIKEGKITRTTDQPATVEPVRGIGRLYSGDVCLLCRHGDRGHPCDVDALSPIASPASWDHRLHYVRPGCRYHYPDERESRRCMLRHRISHIIFVGDSLIRSLYASFLDVLRLKDAPDELAIKAFGKGDQRAFTDLNLSVSYMNMWFSQDLEAVQQQWHNLMEQHPPHRRKTIVVIVNLGLMHQLFEACYGSLIRESTMKFRLFIEGWYGELRAKDRPRIRAVFFGSPSVLGLRNQGVSPAKGQKITALGMQYLTCNRTVATMETSVGCLFPFQLLDPRSMTEPRMDATEDGFHFQKSVRMTQAIGLWNMICDDPRDVDSEWGYRN